MKINSEQFARSPVYPLGYIGSNRFVYFVKGIERVVILSANQHTMQQLLALATEKEWSRYPAVNFSRSSFIEALSERMMADCRSCGQFDPSCIRGYGAWRDRDRIVFNDGVSLLVGAGKAPIGEFRDTKFIYVRASERLSPATKLATAEEGAAFVDALRLWNWEFKEIAPVLLAGWTACAFVCGLLPWRPHIWVTGPKGTGKSTQDRLLTGVLGDVAQAVQGATSEAGLRQLLNSDARPVIFDEFEGSEGNARGVLQLARSAASENAAPVVKGSQHGVAMEFRLRSMMLFSGVITRIINEADASRICVLELRPLRSSSCGDAELKEAFMKFGEASQFGARLLSRMLYSLSCGRFDQALQSLKAAIFRTGGDARRQDLFATLGAGYHVLTRDEAITTEEADAFAAAIAALEQETPSDDEQCLMALLTFRIRSESGVQKTVGELAAIASTSCRDCSVSAAEAKSELARHGLKLDAGSLRVANNGVGIDRIFEGTRWHGSHKGTLKRLPGAVAAGNTRFAPGYQSKAVALPLDLILGCSGSSAE